MLNGVALHYIFNLLLTGGLIMAALYHIIFFLRNSEKMMIIYSILLTGIVILSVSNCMFFFNAGPLIPYVQIEQVLPLALIFIYLHFISLALKTHHEEDVFTWQLIRSLPYLILVYVILNTFRNSEGIFGKAYFIAQIAIPGLLLFTALLLFFSLLARCRSLYFRYITGGFIALLFCYVAALFFYSKDEYVFGAAPLTWQLCGFAFTHFFMILAFEYNSRQKQLAHEMVMQASLENLKAANKKELDELRSVYQALEEERTSIAQNLHEEIGAMLDGIIAKTETSPTTTFEIHWQQLIQSLRAAAADMRNRLNDIVWAVNPSEDTLKLFWQKIETYARESASKKGIEFISKEHIYMPDTRLGMEIRRNSFTLLKEGINNAVAHSNCSHMQLGIVFTNKQVHFTIADNGVGFNTNEVDNSKGFTIMKKNAAEINGVLEIESGPGEGTHIQYSFNLPLWVNSKY